MKCKYDSTNILYIKQILTEMLEKNKHKRLNLTLFLDNNHDVLNFYNINYDKIKYKDYNIKFVPSTIKEWNTLLNKIKKDFNLHNNFQENKPKNNNTTNDTTNNNIINNPKINTFSKITNKNYNIRKIPIIYNKNMKHPNIYKKKTILNYSIKIPKTKI